ncbi:monopolin complex subunit Mam1p [Monosporozyma unispora]|nr:hypothetical protein C6P44_003147 [Kazachstania unispora]
MKTFNLNKVVERPLKNKSINIKERVRSPPKEVKNRYKRSERHLSNKKSLKRECEIQTESGYRREKTKKDPHIQDIKRIRKDEEVEINLPGSNIQPLSKSNLRLLQQEISILETKPEVCKHFLCSNYNMKQVDFSRLWFLFELEMTVTGEINLRNDCYYNKIYNNMGIEWPTPNCLKEKLPSKLIPMQLSQIILPKPLDMTKFTDKEEESLSNLSLFVESVIENDSHVEYKRQRMIPTNRLATRDKREVFENIKIDVKTILQDKTSSSIALEQSFLEDKSPFNNQNKKALGKLSYFRS